ncbi:MAG: prephenate dehydrogenase/arogenate dehydrogenase family protein [Candidatus Bathyarchaeia archaeon]
MKDADLIVISTPIQVTPKVVNEITSHLRKDAVVAEISSLKSSIIENMTKIAELGVRTLSIHPLFGPGALKLAGKKIAVIPVVDSGAEMKLVKELFPEAEIVPVGAGEHDRAMGLSLSLTYFVNMVFASIVGEEDIDALKRLGGTTFTLQLILAESVMTEEPALHAAIQMENEHTSQYIDKFLSGANALKEWITRRDKEKFTALHRHIQELLSKDADFKNAYGRMYEVLEKWNTSML